MLQLSGACDKMLPSEDLWAGMVHLSPCVLRTCGSEVRVVVKATCVRVCARVKPR